MAVHSMTVDEKHRCTSCRQSHPFVAGILGGRLLRAKQEDGLPAATCILLAPGYGDARESGRIAALIARIDPRIPFSFLDLSPPYSLLSWANIETRRYTPCDLSTLSQVG